MFILPVAIGVVFLWQAPVALSAYWILNSILRFIELKIFNLGPIKRKYLNVPTPEEMVSKI
jgi:YidC/Oxa1 family membrane protein insertase